MRQGGFRPMSEHLVNALRKISLVDWHLRLTVEQALALRIHVDALTAQVEIAQANAADLARLKAKVEAADALAQRTAAELAALREVERAARVERDEFDLIYATPDFPATDRLDEMLGAVGEALAALDRLRSVGGR